MAKASGYHVTAHDVPIVLGMAIRGDRNHDIAAWFGFNQGRIKETKDGKYGSPPAAPQNSLPPKGPPGIKGRRIRAEATLILQELESGPSGLQAAIDRLKSAIAQYDAHET